MRLATRPMSCAALLASPSVDEVAFLAAQGEAASDHRHGADRVEVSKRALRLLRARPAALSSPP